MGKIQEIIRINRKFGRTLINRSNLEFDVEMANKEKNLYMANAYIIRGIISGHPFSDGNKRTALIVITNTFQKNKIRCDREKLTRGIINIAKENITDIKKISKRIRKWCLKN